MRDLPALKLQSCIYLWEKKQTNNIIFRFLGYILKYQFVCNISYGK